MIAWWKQWGPIIRSDGLPATLVLLGIIITQLHGMAYWQEVLGVGTGALISVFWDMVAIWSWWTGAYSWSKRVMKWVSTIALAFGMVVSASGPIWSTEEVLAARKENLLQLRGDAEKRIAQIDARLVELATPAQEWSGRKERQALGVERTTQQEKKDEYGRKVLELRPPTQVQIVGAWVLTILLPFVQWASLLALVSLADKRVVADLPLRVNVKRAYMRARRGVDDQREALERTGIPPLEGNQIIQLSPVKRAHAKSWRETISYTGWMRLRAKLTFQE